MAAVAGAQPARAVEEEEDEEQSAEAIAQAVMRAKIMAIIRDTTLTEAEKAKKRQELMCSRPAGASPTKGADAAKAGAGA